MPSPGTTPTVGRETDAPPTWWANGVLFENCSCQLLCPAHVSFKQTCNHERCVGHWAIHVVEGRYGDVSLDDLNVVVVFDAPVQMYEGDWTERVYLDDRATAPQQRALEAIVSGAAGGPWETLGQFVATRLETRAVPLAFVEDADRKLMRSPGLFETEVVAIRARHGRGHATLTNLYNVIHGLVHIMARGRTDCRDAPLDFSIERTHGLYSEFSWGGGNGADGARV